MRLNHAEVLPLALLQWRPPRSPALLFPGRQRLAFAVIGGRRIEIDRLQRGPSGVSYLMPLAAFDHDKTAGAESLAMAFDDRHTAARDHIQPLIGAAMAIIGPALAVARRDDHFRRLHPAHLERNPKAFSETKSLVLHARLHRFVDREPECAARR